MSLPTSSPAGPRRAIAGNTTVIVIVVAVVLVLVIGGLLLYGRMAGGAVFAEANEKAAAATLKSMLFAPMVLFQGQGVIDQDGNGRGEYPLLSELTGRRPLPNGQTIATNVRGDLARGDSAYGYRFAIWLPDGAGGAIGEPAGAGPRPAARGPQTAQERSFVAYAWPLQPGKTGKRVFAFSQEGVVRVAPEGDGSAPAWNALFGGKGWDDPPKWEKLRD